MAREGRPSKHPDHGKAMIAYLKLKGFWRKLVPARSRITDSGHRVGLKPRDEDNE